jgi:hypothetical protein
LGPVVFLASQPFIVVDSDARSGPAAGGAGGGAAATAGDGVLGGDASGSPVDLFPRRDWAGASSGLS